MNEIKCPNCGKVFQVDEAGYAAIVAQVHTEQFDREVADRVRAAQGEMKSQMEALRANAEMQRRRDLDEKERQIIRLQESAK